MPTNKPSWFDTATTIAPTGLGWRLHRGILANGRVGWVLQEGVQGFLVLDVPEKPTAAELVERIWPTAGQFAADTLVGQALATLPALIAQP